MTKDTKDAKDDNTVNANISKLSFEDALSELESLVRTLEEGRARLEDTINLYERGVALKKHCEAKLSTAQARIDKIAVNEQGTPTGTEPLG